MKSPLNLSTFLVAAFVLALHLRCLPAAPVPQPEPDGGAHLTYSLAKPGQVSLAIYDAKGCMVRELLRGQTQNAGSHKIFWDGLDASGKSSPPGNYTWKLLHHPGLRSEFVMNIGVSSGTHHWVGNHGGPEAVAVDGNDAYTSANPEVTPQWVKFGLDGSYDYAMPATNPVVSPADMAAENGKLYKLDSAGGLTVTNGLTGKDTSTWRTGQVVTTLDGPGLTQAKEQSFTIPVPPGHYFVRLHYGDEQHQTSAVNYKFGERGGTLPPQPAGPEATAEGPRAYDGLMPQQPVDGKLTLNLQNGNPGENWSVTKIEVVEVPSRLDVRAGEIAVCYESGKVVWLKEGVSDPTAETKVIHPADIAIVAPGKLMALSGDDLVVVTRDGATSEVRATGLVHPLRVCYDAKSGDALVVESAPSWQIKRIAPDGRVLERYGRAGGRQEGLYIPEDFLEVSDIAADGQGGFVVSEATSAPRRTAHFDASGKLLREWYGGQLFFTHMSVDPQNPSLVWFDSPWGWVVQAEADYAARKWKVRATYRIVKEGSDTLSAYSYAPGGWQVKRHGNETYLVITQQSPTMVRVDEAGHRLVPVMMARTNYDHYWDNQPAALHAMFAKRPDPQDPKSTHFFSWSDLNNDGTLQRDEVEFSPWRTWNPTAWFTDDAFNLSRAWKLDEGQGEHEIATLHPTWKGTVPVYENMDDATRFKTQAATGGARDIWRDNDSNTYAILLGGGDGYIATDVNGMAHSGTWPANLSDAASLAKFDAQGHRLWQAGSKAVDSAKHPGEFYDPVRVAGIANGCLAIAERIVQPCGFWTTDGLYVGGMFDSRAQDSLPDRLYSWWRPANAPNEAFDDFEKALSPINYDMFVGAAAFEEKPGQTIVLAAGWNSIPVYRVYGFDQLERAQGEITLKASLPAAAQNGGGLLGSYFTGTDLIGQPQATHTDDRIWFDTRHKWLDAPVTTAAFSARWTGEVEAKYSEPYVFGVYSRGGTRLWVAGNLVIDEWNGAGGRSFSAPIPMEAGKRYPIRLEWRKGADEPQVHLVWHSTSQAVEHIPASSLYAKDYAAFPEVMLRATRNVASNQTPAEITFSRVGDNSQPLTISYRTVTNDAVPAQELATVTIPAGNEQVVVPFKAPPGKARSEVSFRLDYTGAYRFNAVAGYGMDTVRALPPGNDVVIAETFNRETEGAANREGISLVSRGAGDRALQLSGDNAEADIALPQTVSGDFRLEFDMYCGSDKMFPVRLQNDDGEDILSIYRHNAANGVMLWPAQRAIDGCDLLISNRWTHWKMERKGAGLMLTVAGDGIQARAWELPNVSRQGFTTIRFGVSWAKSLWDNVILTRAG